MQTRTASGQAIRIVAAALGGLALALVLAAFPFQRFEIDYNGSCGRVRVCTTRVLILKNCDAAPQDAIDGARLEPFAPLSECQDDWHRLKFSAQALAMISDGSAHDPQGRAIGDLADLDALETSIFFARGRYDYKQAQPFLDDMQPYAPARCGGRKTRLDRTEYEVVVATPPDGDAQDCWSINSNHQLRHLSRLLHD